MTKTYSQIIEQIEALKQQADSLRQKEMTEVVGRIKQAISFYQLTAADLGLGNGAKTATASKGSAPTKRGPKGADYSDGTGNTWSGRGPRPRWLKAALAAGKSLDDFRAPGGSSAPMLPSAPGKKTKSAKKKAAAVVKYRDESGNTWSGRGPRPSWIKAGLAAGKAMESFAA